jgi:hypothetical protein
MSIFIFADEEDNEKKINIDELYEKRQSRELKQVSIFNKILNRIHKRIQFTGKNKTTDKHIWFNVPEYIFGEPIYNKGDCIGYLYTKLQDNGFHIRYMHPNTLFVSWAHWIPSYVRQEIKKKTGMVIDQNGNIISTSEDQDSNDPNSNMLNNTKQTGKPQKEYTPVSDYKPSGKLVYDNEMFSKLEKKVTFQNG